MYNFILGILFGVVVDAFGSFLGQLTEYICTKIAVASAKEKMKVNPQDEGAETPVIGFQIPSEGDYYEEEEEE